MPTPAQIDDAIETLGNLVAMEGGEGDEALDVLKDAVIRPRLAGSQEVATILGVTPTAIDKIAGGLPEPLDTLAVGRVWLREDIEALAKARKARRR